MKEKYSQSLKDLNNKLPMDSRKLDVYKYFYAFESLLLNTNV